MKAKAKNNIGASEGMAIVKDFCLQAQRLADTIFDKEMKQQAVDIFEEAHEQVSEL